jgi:hypothetical protein
MSDSRVAIVGAGELLAHDDHAELALALSLALAVAAVLSTAPAAHGFAGVATSRVRFVVAW